MAFIRIVVVVKTLCTNSLFYSVGIYPNCTCSNDAFYHFSSKQCKVPYGCAENKDKDNYESDTEPDYDCIHCPLDSTGVYPNCICEEGMYNEEGNYCLKCSWGSVGVYPNCTCEANGTYISDTCYICPEDSIGQYPNCNCSHPFQYLKDDNVCVQCPENSSGIYPKCRCSNNRFFSRFHKACIECPLNATGFYPNCKCSEEGHKFSAFINECYIACPEDSIGKHPQCNCQYEHYYDVNDFVCKSNTGRKCSLDSIGVGPDCLCILEEHNFNSYYWSCCSAGYFSTASNPCPDNSGKCPQCETSIERNTLLSLIG